MGNIARISCLIKTIFDRDTRNIPGKSICKLVIGESATLKGRGYGLNQGFELSGELRGKGIFLTQNHVI
jgi:hypothetical protein